jgi:hypothetical protein
MHNIVELSFKKIHYYQNVQKLNFNFSNIFVFDGK